MSKVYRVDMEKKEVREEEPGRYERYGGRAFTSMVLSAEVSPVLHPLGKSNKLVISPGLLSGTMAANSGRLSIGAKSPLTGGIKESNVGGAASTRLARLGVKGLVIENISADGGLSILVVKKDGVELKDGSALKGMKNYQLVEKLKAEYGEKAAVISIGPAGEMKMSSASIAVTDTNGRPSRHAGRGGMGAVMGSKGLKAVVIDDRGSSPLSYSDKDAFKAAAGAFRDALKANPVTKPGGGLAMFGTNSLVSAINEAGGFPTRNFSQGKFEAAARISGEALFKMLKERGGETTHSACTGCIIQCSNVFVDDKGEYVTSGLEYETVWANGANCGVDDLDALARADRLCDDIGLDTIETGCAVAVAMEAGVLEFGDAKGLLDLIEQAGRGTHLGRIIGNGAAVTGQVFGVSRVPVVKRQSMPAYDPRAVKGIGVTYATSPMGADHTAGYTIASNIMGLGGRVDPLKPEGQAELSRMQQAAAAVLDSLGLCTFVSFAIIENDEGYQSLPRMVNALMGWDMSLEDLMDYGRQVLIAERKFNEGAGFSSSDDRLPEFMEKEPLPPHNTVFDVPEKDLDGVLDF